MTDISQPLTAKLAGGPLDGDEFELIPNGSVLPPMRLSYAFEHENRPCWMHYQAPQIVEWEQNAVLYHFSGFEYFTPATG